MDAIVADLKGAFEVVRTGLTDGFSKPMTAEQEAALAHLETFAAISIRVMRGTNPSKLRDAARAEEIKARIEGREVLKDE